MKKQVSNIYEKVLLKNNINDVWEQGRKALIPLTDKEKEQRRNEIFNCNHEFIVYDTNIVECVHCGLTNKHTILEHALNISQKDRTFKTYETELYEEYNKNTKELNYISTIKLKSNHIKILYDLAYELASNKDDNIEIFDIMEELSNLENYTEKRYICSLDDTIWLLHRYKEKRIFKMSKSVKKLIKKIDI